MWYLFLQIWVWLLIAFVLGWWAHWFFCCRGKESATDDSAAIDLEGQSNSNTVAAAAVAATAVPKTTDSWKPMGFAAAPDSVDDLKRIKGVGSVIEETLNGLGIYQFSQIASWNDDNISWVENSLSFPGRITREDWINQAKTLDDGGTTEFANRVDKGDVGYD